MRWPDVFERVVELVPGLEYGMEKTRAAELIEAELLRLRAACDVLKAQRDRALASDGGED